MRILVHDYSGHPFQVQLSRELSRRGHAVTHSYCAAYTSGKGQLAAEAGESIAFEPIGLATTIAKLSFGKRLLQEARFGGELVRQVRRVKPDVVLAANTPIPTLMILAAFLRLRRIPWVLWHQDVQTVAIGSFAGTQLSRAFKMVASAIGIGEKWCARRAAAVVVIAESFLDVHRKWGTLHKTIVIPNWAPLEEIRPVTRANDWSHEHGLDDTKTLLYSGTLGLKHNPELLVALACEVINAGTPIQLVVVNEGPAESVLRESAARLDVPLTLLPFQPYERLSEVLGSGDVLVVLLEQNAGAFSVPSKTLSYLCAGRPVLGLMPPENLAASLIARGEGAVLPSSQGSLPAAAHWITGVLSDDERSRTIGKQSRALAEREFALEHCLDRFETLLLKVAG